MADAETGSLFFQHYIFSKYEIDYYRMNNKRNAEKMFVKEGITPHEYYKYLIFQIQRSYRIIGDPSRFRDAHKCQVDALLERQLQTGLSHSAYFESKDSHSFLSSAKSHGPIFHKRSCSGESSMHLPSSHRQLDKKRLDKSIERSRGKGSLWKRLAERMRARPGRVYEEYESVPNLRFLRVNNLLLEVAYFENRGTGRIAGVNDAVALEKQGPVDPRVFVKKLDSFQSNYFEVLFERNEARHKQQFSHLLRKCSGHLEESRLGVFFFENKICELCGKKNSPFDLIVPLGVARQDSHVHADASGFDGQNWMRRVLNAQAKKVFVLPCDLLGVDFKERYIAYLRSSRPNRRHQWHAHAVLPRVSALACGAATGRLDRVLRPEPAEMSLLLRTHAPATESRLDRQAAAELRPVGADRRAFADKAFKLGLINRAGNNNFRWVYMLEYLTIFEGLLSYRSR